MRMIEKIINNNGRDIEVSIFMPDEPICAIQLMHGMAEHKGRYTAMMTWLAMNDCMVIMHNHRGHGPEAKKLGHFESLDVLADDAIAVSRLLPANIPSFILGHSMGSIIARRLLEQNIYDGAIIVATGNKKSLIETMGVKLLKLLAAVAPEYRSPIINSVAVSGYDGAFKGEQKNRWLSEDDSRVSNYNQDPYCGFLMSNRALLEIARNIDESLEKKNLKRLNADVPILLIGGKSDPFSKYGADIRSLGRTYRKYVDSVTVQLYEESRHEVLFEKNRAQVYNRLLGWVRRHV